MDELFSFMDKPGSSPQSPIVIGAAAADAAGSSSSSSGRPAIKREPSRKRVGTAPTGGRKGSRTGEKQRGERKEAKKRHRLAPGKDDTKPGHDSGRRKRPRAEERGNDAASDGVPADIKQEEARLARGDLPEAAEAGAWGDEEIDGMRSDLGELIRAHFFGAEDHDDNQNNNDDDAGDRRGAVPGGSTDARDRPNQEGEHAPPRDYGEFFSDALVGRFVQLHRIVEKLDSGTPSDAYGGQDTDGLGALLPLIPDLPRAYIKDFLREAVAELGERACAMGTACEALALARHHAIKEQPFALRELLLDEHVEALQDGLNAGKAVQAAYAAVAPQPCILCSRVATQKLAIALGAGLDARDGEPETPPSRALRSPVAQSHANLFDREGEYRSDTAMLQAGTSYHGLIKPIVKYNRDHYAPLRHDVYLDAHRSVNVRGWAERSIIIFSAAAAESHR